MTSSGVDCLRSTNLANQFMKPAGIGAPDLEHRIPTVTAPNRGIELPLAIVEPVKQVAAGNRYVIIGLNPSTLPWMMIARSEIGRTDNNICRHPVRHAFTPTPGKVQAMKPLPALLPQLNDTPDLLADK